MGFSIFKKKITERRKSLRKDKVFIAQCEVNDKKSFSTIIDISNSGLGVYLEYPINIGTIIKITLQYQYIKGAYSSTPIKLPLLAKVVWVKEELIKPDIKNTPVNIEDVKYRAGLEFENLNDELKEKFKEFLKI